MKYETYQRVAGGGGHRPIERVSLDTFQDIDTNSVSGQYQGVFKNTLYYVQSIFYKVRIFLASIRFFLSFLIIWYEIGEYESEW